MCLVCATFCDLQLLEQIKNYAAINWQWSCTNISLHTFVSPAQAETAPQSLKPVVEQSAARVPPEPKRRGRKPKPADEKKNGRTQERKTQEDRERFRQEPQNTRRRQKSSPAVGPVEAKPKRSSRKKETQKREPKKEAAKPRTTKKDTRNRKTMSPEEAEKAALKSRQDSCYHVTRRKLNKEGMCDEDAKVEARKVTRLSICANCLFEKKRKVFSMSRPPVPALYSIFDFS